VQRFFNKIITDEVWRLKNYRLLTIGSPQLIEQCDCHAWI